MGVGDYLEIKQDADEFLEKLNKKKNDTKNKFNKYSILIKKRQTSKLSSDINNNIIYLNVKNENEENLPVLSEIVVTLNSYRLHPKNNLLRCVLHH